MINTLLLEHKILKSGYKKSYIAQFLGINKNTFANKVHNKSDFTVSEAAKIVKLLNLDNNEAKEIFLS